MFFPLFFSKYIMSINIFEAEAGAQVFYPRTGGAMPADSC